MYHIVQIRPGFRSGWPGEGLAERIIMVWKGLAERIIMVWKGLAERMIMVWKGLAKRIIMVWKGLAERIIMVWKGLAERIIMVWKGLAERIIMVWKGLAERIIMAGSKQGSSGICFWQDVTGPPPGSHFQTRLRSFTDISDQIAQNQPGSDLVLQ